MANRGFLRALAEIQFINLKDFSDDMEQLIKETSDRHIQHLEDLSKELTDEEEKDMFWEYNIDRVHQLRKDYPNILRSSLLVSYMSNMEKVLVGIHEDLKASNIELKNLKIISMEILLLKGLIIYPRGHTSSYSAFYA